MNKTFSYTDLVGKKVITSKERKIFISCKQNIELLGIDIFNEFIRAYVEEHGPILSRKDKTTHRGYYNSMAYIDKLIIAYLLYTYYSVTETYISSIYKVDRSTLSILRKKTIDSLFSKSQDEFSQVLRKRLQIWLLFSEKVLEKNARLLQLSEQTDAQGVG